MSLVWCTIAKHDVPICAAKESRRLRGNQAAVEVHPQDQVLPESPSTDLKAACIILGMHSWPQVRDKRLEILKQLSDVQTLSQKICQFADISSNR